MPKQRKQEEKILMVINMLVLIMQEIKCKEHNF
jgi:hypothetical protein